MVHSGGVGVPRRRSEPKYEDSGGLTSNGTVMTNVSARTGSGRSVSRAASTVSRTSTSTDGPGWTARVRGDYDSGNIRVVATQDLLCWMFQVLMLGLPTYYVLFAIILIHFC